MDYTTRTALDEAAQAIVDKYVANPDAYRSSDAYTEELQSERIEQLENKVSSLQKLLSEANAKIDTLSDWVMEAAEQEYLSTDTLTELANILEIELRKLVTKTFQATIEISYYQNLGHEEAEFEDFDLEIRDGYCDSIDEVEDWTVITSREVDGY